MQQWKTRMVMPERLEGLEGFGALKGLPRDGKRKEDPHWAAESSWRQMINGMDAQDAQKRREDVDKLIADKQVNAYGERLPPRARGELLPPWAEREDLGVRWRT